VYDTLFEATWETLQHLENKEAQMEDEYRFNTWAG
jgi:hypothetical protein